MNKLELIKRNTVEIITEDELLNLLKTKKNPIVYCGYEPSGPLHLGHMVTITKLKDLQEAGFKIKILLADVHAYLNKKGNWKFLDEQCEIWKKSIKAIGLNAEFIKGSSFQYDKNYWNDVLTISLKTTIQRGLRSMTEIARDPENASISQAIYPVMQTVDMKALKVDIGLGGMEQRKVQMLARETLSLVNYKPIIAIHTPLISSLKGAGKMSSSIPGSMISVIDSPTEIRNAVKGAHCPAKIVKDNPVMQIAQLIVFPNLTGFFKIVRPDKFGGNLQFSSYEELERAYVEGKLHPADLKSGVADTLVEILGPIGKKFHK
ncbi:MAG: tyrosine--tRNA ligase [Nanoarchaeota archaeon]